jgi:HSP20 family protein
MGLCCRADFKETREGYVASAELPGVNKEDINVTVENGILLISAEKKRKKIDEKENILLEERSYGKIERSFRLPVHCDVGNVSAKFEDGVLELYFGKDPQASQRKIEIS